MTNLGGNADNSHRVNLKESRQKTYNQSGERITEEIRSSAKPIKLMANEVQQLDHKLYIFRAQASVLYGASINRRMRTRTKVINA